MKNKSDLIRCTNFGEISQVMILAKRQKHPMPEASFATTLQFQQVFVS